MTSSALNPGDFGRFHFVDGGQRLVAVVTVGSKWVHLLEIAGRDGEHPQFAKVSSRDLRHFKPCTVKAKRVIRKLRSKARRNKDRRKSLKRAIAILEEAQS